MGKLLNNDDAIWLKHVSADSDTVAMLHRIPAGAKLKIEIEGISGEWQRMADGKDGRPTLGLKPVGPTVDFWKSMKSRRGELLQFKIIDPRDTYLADVEKTLSEWHSEDDERAFGDL